MNTILTVSLYTIIWCVVHSLLIDAWKGKRWARLLYNMIAGISLVAFLIWVRTIDATPIWHWHGPWQLLRIALLVTGVVIAQLGAAAHDNGEFLGFRQFRHTRATPPPLRLSREGILRIVRHPWYTAGLLILPTWPATFTDVNLAWRGVFVVYLVVGSWIEDRRLIHKFGSEYKQYSQEVPGLIPRWSPSRD
jgi:methanethiol S-methyltransferase